MPNSPATSERSLEVQREEFSRRRLMAMPIAGTIMWAIIGLIGALNITGMLDLSVMAMMLVVFICTGSIAYLGMFISRFTGENMLDKSRPKNTFDGLFFLGMGAAMAVFAIAIPFAMIEPNSVTMTVGILTGLMWMPLTWIIDHPIGVLHTVSRIIACLVLYYALPDLRFVAIPAAIVVIYLVTLVVLQKRWKTVNA